MSKESHLRSVFEHALPSVLASFEHRPLPVSAHQALSDLYEAVDRYCESVNRNKLSSARYCAERILVETLRTLVAYEMPLPPKGVDKVKIETKKGPKEKVRVS